MGLERLLADVEERFALVEPRLTSLIDQRAEFAHHRNARGRGIQKQISIPWTPLAISRDSPDWRYQQFNTDIAACRYAMESVPLTIERARRALAMTDDAVRGRYADELWLAHRTLDRANIPSRR